MTVAAVMLVKDEEDIIGPNLRWLSTQVDAVYVLDNLSTDATREIATSVLDDAGIGYSVETDKEVGYYQSKKTTKLAKRALADGHSWVVPVDADEIWYSPFGRVGDVLAELDELTGPRALFASAKLLNYVPTDADPGDPNPLVRIGWRLRELGRLPKVACRTDPTLVIGMGNHEALVEGIVHSSTSGTLAGQLYVRHYPWRSEEQFLRKITNGALAYKAAGKIARTTGEHWRQFGLPGSPGFEQNVRAWFREWGYRSDPDHPTSDKVDELIYDPMPR